MSGEPSSTCINEGRDRKTNAVKWTATPVDLVFGSNSELRAIADDPAYTLSGISVLAVKGGEVAYEFRHGRRRIDDDQRQILHHRRVLEPVVQQDRPRARRLGRRPEHRSKPVR